MITDAVLRLLATILQKIVDLIPPADVIAVGNGAASGTLCCATYLVTGIEALLASVPGATVTSAGLLNKTPLPLLIDFTYFGFFVGCLMAIGAAFFIIKILLLMWQQIKW